MFASRIAKSSGMGVLAVDFRNLQDTDAQGFEGSNEGEEHCLSLTFCGHSAKD